MMKMIRMSSTMARITRTHQKSRKLAPSSAAAAKHCHQLITTVTTVLIHIFISPSGSKRKQ